MNRTLLIWFAKRGCIVVPLTFVYAMPLAHFAGEYWAVSPNAVVVVMGIFALYATQMRRYAPMLNTLPVSQRAIALGFWSYFVVCIPTPFALLEILAYLQAREDVAWYNLPTPILEAWITALGMAATWSVFSGMAIRVNDSKAPVRLGIATLATLALACALSTTYVPSIEDDPLEGNIVLAVSIIMIGYSYVRAEDAWGPRQFVAQQKQSRQYLEISRERARMSGASRPSGFFGVYQRPAIVGVACGIGLLAISSAVIAIDRGGVGKHEFAEGAPIAITLVCIGLIASLPYWMPNMRSLRILPLSRARLTCYVLGYALSAFLGAPILVGVGHYLFGWNPSTTTTLLCASAGLYLCGTVGGIRFGGLAMMFPALIVMIPMGVIFYDRSPAALIPFGIAMGAVAYYWLYALLGNGDAVYQRSNPLNTFTPYED
ncbi:MAG: hypothetical protein IT365_24240 [Candidatus Hydrogenedentes bacterium]|nr:hypothetical protein [Candidatus Hydrogenedentota bacterium]